MEAEILSAQSRKNKFGQYFTPATVAKYLNISANENSFVITGLLAVCNYLP